MNFKTQNKTQALLAFLLQSTIWEYIIKSPYEWNYEFGKISKLYHILTNSF